MPIKPNVEIKRAERDELYGVAVFLDECWKSEYRQIISDDYLDSIAADERYERLLERYDNGLSEFLIMTLDNNLIGVSVFGKSVIEHYENDGEISAIYLHHNYIGKGYGHFLFSEIEKTLHEKGFDYFILDVLSENKRALKFYLRHDYKVVDERLIKLGDTEYPLVVMRKSA